MPAVQYCGSAIRLTPPSRGPRMNDVAVRLHAALADRYRVERELGQGGMATVYLAHDLKHDRDVAIKVLHPDLGAALGGDRFSSEIRTTARLQHPHILGLSGAGSPSRRHSPLPPASAAGWLARCSG